MTNKERARTFVYTRVLPHLLKPNFNDAEFDVMEGWAKVNAKIDMAGVCDMVAALLDDRSQEFNRRANELLAHNNELLERARKAERERDDARAGMLAAASLTQKIIAAFGPGGEQQR